MPYAVPEAGGLLKVNVVFPLVLREKSFAV